ncbi:MAG: hypothetical protein KGO96_10655 [Elusimicrobia bacterium]|nr:hypothetical protein [Elusimicrobiota bacterium]
MTRRSSVPQSRFSGAGYLIVDGREADLLVCARCSGLILVQDRVDASGGVVPGHRSDGAYCHRCDGPLCGAGLNNCAASAPCDRGSCRSFRATLEEQVDDNYRRGQNARVLGI